MRSKRMVAHVLVTTLVFQSFFGNVTVNAAELSENSETTEYIVQVKNEEALAEVLEEKEADIVADSGAEELKEQQMTVLELTENEAEELLEEKDIILVEENVILEASTAETTENKKNTKKKEKSNKNKEKKSSQLQNESLSQEEWQSKIDKKKLTQADASDLQWNLSAIHLPEEAVGNDTIKIALVDSGVSYDEDIPIAERIYISDGLETENVLFDDATGHGTGLAGLIAAQDDNSGIRGVNPNAELYSIQILNEQNQTTLSNLIASLYKAIELDCNIINLSLGTSVDSELLHMAVRDAYDAGILIVAAAGNTEGGAVEYPAAYKEVLAVGSTDTTGNRVTASCDGEEIEIFAPGSQIPVTGLFGGILVMEGTSAAAAQVTGAASLIWSIDKNKSAGFVRSLLVNTAQTVEEKGISQAGLVDVENAVAKYDELSDIYVEEKVDYQSIQADNQKTEEYLDVELVNGSWSGKLHTNMMSNALSYYNIKSQYVTLMEICASLPDKNYKNVSYLHGTHNYVKGLKFLYQCAGYLRSGQSEANSIKQAAKDANLSPKVDEKGNPNNDKLLVDGISKLLEENVLAGVEEDSAGAKYYKVLGFAMHLAGDIYAHRTIVPEYTITGNNPSAYKSSTSATSYDAKFGTSNFISQSTHDMESNDTLIKWASQPVKYEETLCGRWKCFQKTIKLGHMEFRDIYHYSKGNTRGIYEDNPNFCRERYVDAKFICEVLFDESYTKEEFDGVFILYPTEDNVKLNNLRGYAKNAGEDIGYFTTEEWKEISTLAEY